MGNKPDPSIVLVVAVAENGVIGRDGELPWRMPSDLKRFRQMTLGKPIIMGRKTFQSIGKPLDGRLNIIVTRDRTFACEGIKVAYTLEQALEIARSDTANTGAMEVAVIGGAEIFRAALPLADRIYLTRIHASPEGDVRLEDPAPEDWKEIGSEMIPRGPKDEFDATLVTYARRTAS